MRDTTEIENTVRLIPSGSYVSFRVSDTGVGMSEEVREHAFEPFFTTKASGEGSGLGLATVYGIVSQSGGYTSLVSEQGLGTSITILLPAAEQEAVRDEITGRIDNLDTLGGSETILVTDDENEQREVAKRILTRNGYTVLTASSGAHAIEFAESYAGPIDLLLTDVIMPQMQGPTVAREVKALRPDIRVLFMSGHAHPVLEAEALLGMEFLLMEKPFDETTILQNIRKVLDSDV
jgi:CheY-like chemotaxis protein